MSDVKIVKLMSGQEIIAKVIAETDQELSLASPLTIQPMRSSETTLSVGLMPFTWAGVCDSGVSINKQHVLCIMPPEDGLKTQYLAGLAGLTVSNVTSGVGTKLTLVD